MSTDKIAVCLAYMTFRDEAEAREIGEKLLQEKLVACLNIFPAVQSLYLWEGKLQSEAEVVALAKLKEENFPILLKLVQEDHSYETPCILKLPVKDGHKPFLDWVGAS